MSILYLILIVVVIAASNWWFGSWNIAINLINFFISALIASSFFEPVADWLETFDNTFTYLVDFVAIWMLFAVSFVSMRIVTDLLSKYQLRMNIWAEYVLRTVLSLWLAGGFVCFTFFTFHLAPFPINAFVSHPKTTLYGLGPDKKWMAFVQSRSRGALAESKTASFLPEYDLQDHPDDIDLNARVFDPFAEFSAKYIARRSKLSKSITLRVKK